MLKAKLFENGRSQAVRLPKQFRFEGKEVYIKKVGESVHLIPVKKNPWADFEEALSLFDSSFFPEGREQPKLDKREKF